ncbi:MAG: protein kinase domain-containing protein [Candidatus Promineifilaceae bacterium]
MTDELIGQYIDRFRVDALLGEGNMGSVYQAYDSNLARKVVLKVMHRQLANHESFQKRFMQEAQAAARLDHPSIVKLYSFDTEPNLYMEMEYIEGPSLGEYLKHSRQQNEVINLDTVLRLIAQVADALDYAHGQGVIHRDIKPSNVLLKPLKRPDREGDPALRVVVSDFGLAKLLEGGMHTLTGTFMGTLSYMSPEQCLGRELDGRSDIYSLGIVLYQVTTGQLPFNIKSPTDAIRMHVKEIPPAPRLVRPGLSEAIEQVILQAIAKNPASRFQTGNQFATALRRVAQSLTHPSETNATMPDSHALSSGGRQGSSVMVQQPPNTSTIDQLLIYHAGEAPRIVSLTDEEYIVGRGQENNITLPDKGVSRNHVKIEKSAEGGWQVSDIGSTNGTFLDKMRLAHDTPEIWQPNTELRVGPYSLQWQQATTIPAPPPINDMAPAELPMDDRPSQTSPGEIEIVVDPANSAIAAGDSVSLQVMLINRGPIVEHVNVRVEKIAAEWINYSQEMTTLMPGSRGFVRVAITPPRHYSSQSGAHAFQIVATPMSNPDALVSAICQVNIQPFAEFSAEIPNTNIRNAGRVNVSIINEGNAEATYVISGNQDRDELVTFSPETVKIRARPGEYQNGEISVAAVRRHWIGGVQRVPFEIEIWSKGAGSKHLRSDLEIRPKFPTWLLVAVLTLLLASVIFMLLLFLIPVGT